MAIFSNFQKIQKTLNPPRKIPLSKPIETGDIETAASQAAQAEAGAAQSFSEEAQAELEKGRDISNVANIVAKAGEQYQSNMFYNAMGQVQGIAKNAQALITHSNDADHISNAQVAAATAMKGLHDAISPTMSDNERKEVQAAITNYTGMLNQQATEKKGKISFDNSYYSTVSGINPYLKNVALNYTQAETPKQRQAVLNSLGGKIKQLETLQASAPTTERAVKINNLVRKVSSLGAVLTQAQRDEPQVGTDISTEASNQILSGSKTSNAYYDQILQGGSARNSLDIGTESPDNILTDFSIGQTMQKMRNGLAMSSHVSDDVNHWADSQNPVAQKVGKFYKKLIDSGRGQDALIAMNPNGLLARARKQWRHNMTPDNYANYKQALESEAAHRGIPVNKIDLMPESQKAAYNNTIDSMLVRDNQGNVTGYQPNFDHGSFQHLFSEVWNQEGSNTIFGNSPAVNGINYARFMPGKDGIPQNEYAAAKALTSFNTNVQNSLAKDPELYGKDSDVMSGIGAKNHNELLSNILNDPTRYKLDEVSQMTGIDRVTIGKSIAAQIEIGVKNGLSDTESNKEVIKSLSDMAQTHKTFNGNSGMFGYFGTHYSVNPDTVNKVAGSLVTKSEISQVAPLVIQKRVDLLRHNEGLRYVDSHVSDDPKIQAGSNEILKEKYLDNMVGDVSDWSLITSNGGVYMRNGEGRKIQIDPLMLQNSLNKVRSDEFKAAQEKKSKKWKGESNSSYLMMQTGTLQ
jgi:hypothetical protein